MTCCGSLSDRKHQLWRAGKILQRWQLGSNKNPITKPQVIDAALSCLERYGVAKTSIVDVAREMGVSRQTVHRLFETRSDLLTAIADILIGRLAVRLQRAFQSFPDLETALVEGSMLSLELGQSEPILSDIMRLADHAVDQFIFRGSPSVQASMLSVWGPLIDQARAADRLRSDLATEECVEWIRNVHAMLTLRDDYNETRRKEMLTKFLIPAIMINK